MRSLLLVAIVFCVVGGIQGHAIRNKRLVFVEDNSCRTPDNVEGQCVRMTECPPLLRMLTGKITQATIDSLRKSICGFQGKESKVCCPPVHAVPDVINPVVDKEEKPTSLEPAHVEVTSAKPEEKPMEPGTSTVKPVHIDVSSEHPVDVAVESPTSTVGPVHIEVSSENPVDVAEPATSTVEPAVSQEPLTEPAKLEVTEAPAKPDPVSTTVVENGPQLSCGEMKVKGTCPWCVHLTTLVTLDISTGAHSSRNCIGVLVSDRHIVASAHCAQGILISARVGHGDIPDQDAFTSILEGATVAKVLKHELYDAQSLENNLAVLLLEKKVTFTDSIQPICLPRLSPFTKMSSFSPFASGFQHVTDKSLNTPVSVNVAEVKTCADSASDDLDSQKFVCVNDASDGNSCQKTSGGPIFSTDDQSGRVQLIALLSSKECGQSSRYTPIFKHVPWIESKLKMK